jgi:DNA-directed RNA polymerase specialized sigma subunit
MAPSPIGLSRGPALTAPPATLRTEYFGTSDPRERERLLAAHAGHSLTLDELPPIAFACLLAAMDGFDHTFGPRFATYAAPTIIAELKRNLCEQCRSIHPPRRVHDPYPTVEQAVDDLARELGRPPTAQEAAVELGAPAEDAVDAVEAATGRPVQSLETSLGEVSLTDVIGTEDQRLHYVDGSVDVDALLEQVSVAAPRNLRHMQLSRVFARGSVRLRVMADGQAVLSEWRRP